MADTNISEKPLSQVIAERRDTPSFDGEPIPDEDLRRILEAGLQAPSGYNMQPWRFIVVQSPEQKKRLRVASFNQAKVEEASAVIVACGDADGWRTGDLEEVLRLGHEHGISESYLEQARDSIPKYFSSHPNLPMWLNRHVMIAFTYMMLTAEAMGYDTSPMEGFEEEKVSEALKLPLSYHVASLLAIGHLEGADKVDSGRFDMAHTVFAEEYGKPMRLEEPPPEDEGAEGSAADDSA
jgi:nitroreductase